MHTAIPASQTGSRTCVVLSHTGACSVEGSRWVCHTEAENPWHPPPHHWNTEEARSGATGQKPVVSLLESTTPVFLVSLLVVTSALNPGSVLFTSTSWTFGNLICRHQIFTTHLRHGCMSSRWDESLLGGAAGVPRSLWEGHGCLPKRMVCHGGWQCNTHTRMRGHDLKKVDLPGTTRSAGNLHADSGAMKLTKHPETCFYRFMWDKHSWRMQTSLHVCANLCYAL